MGSFLDRSVDQILAKRDERIELTANQPVDPAREAYAHEVEEARRSPAELVDHHVQTRAEAEVAAAALKATNERAYEEFQNQPEEIPAQGERSEFADY